jgi:uncharacterized protein YndB with AHSA1/START domain
MPSELRDRLDDLARGTAADAALAEYRAAVDTETAAAQADPAWAEGRVVRLTRRLGAAPTRPGAGSPPPSACAAGGRRRHFTVADCAVDPRPGGAMRLVLEEGDGTRHVATGSVTAAEAPRALDFEMSPLGPDGAPLFTTTQALRLHPDAGGTRLSMEIRIAASTPGGASGIAGIRMGWEASLDTLARLAT